MSGGSLGERLFRARLAVIIGFFVAAAVLAAALARLTEPHALPAFMMPLTATFDRTCVLGVCGALSLVAFALRTAGEARLGSAVYGQEASTRVVTGGPFRVMRHPLYAGTWLFFAATFAPWLGPVPLGVVAVLFGASLRFIAVYEEGALAAKHGDAWARYAAAVPRFFGVPRAVEPDGVHLTAAASVSAALGNLGIASLGVYRLFVAAGVDVRGMRLLSLGAMVAWIAIVSVRRLRRS